MTKIYLLLFLLFYSCLKTSNSLGDSPANPIDINIKKFTASAELPSFSFNKRFLNFEAVALTGFYSYTYPANTSEEKENGKAFYFPIVVRKFKKNDDKISVFAYCSYDLFKQITNNFNNLNFNTRKSSQIIGITSNFLYSIPNYVLEKFKKTLDLKISKHFITLKITSIENVKKSIKN